MAKRVGQAFIAISPSFRGFKTEVTAFAKTLKPIAVPVELDASNAVVKPPKKPVKVGAELDNGAFDRNVRRKLQAAIAALPPVRIGAESSEADQAMKDVSARLAALADKRIGIDIDDADALAEIAALEAELETLAARTPTVSVRTNVAAALTELAAINAAVERLDGKSADVSVRTGRAFAAISALENRLDRLAKGRFLINVGVAMSPLASPLGAGLAGGAGGLLGIGTALAGGGAAVGVGLTSLKRITEAQKANEAATKANEAAQRSAGATTKTVSRQRVDYSRQIERAERNVAAATDSVRVAQDRVKDSLRTLHEARQQAIRDLQDLRDRSADNALTIESAEIGVLDAQAALTKAENDRRSTALDLRKARLGVAEAEDRLADARRQATRDAQDLAEAEKKGVRRADGVVAARKQVTEARKGVKDARQDVRDARADLADIRRQAAQSAVEPMQAETRAAVVQRQALIALSPAQLAAASSLGLLKTRWKAFQDTTDPYVLPMLSKGMNALGLVLKPFAAFLRPVTAAVGGFFDQIGRDVSSPGFLRFSRELGTFSAGVLVDAGRGTRNLARAFGNLLKAFMPLSTDMSGGLVKLTARFEKWTAGLEKSKGFQAFVSYVKTNGPVLLSTLGALSLAVIEVGIAVAPLAEQMLGAIAVFSRWLASFAQAHPEVVRLTVGIFVASRAMAAIAVATAPVISLFTTLAKGSVWLWGKVQILFLWLNRIWWLFKNLTPWGRAITIALLLGTALVTAYKKSETFRRIVDGAFTVVRRGAGKLKDAFVAVKDGIANAWGKLGDIIKRPIRGAVSVINGFIDALNKLPFVNISPIEWGQGAGSAKKGVVRDRGQTRIGGRGSVLAGSGPRRSALKPKGSGGRGGKGGKGDRPAVSGRAWPANTKALSNNYPGHSGVDIAAAMGSPIKAAAAGTVEYVGWGRGYGQAIFQSMPGGLSAVYGHTSATNVREGQRVRPGQIIGRVGSTGRSTGPHLHFELNAVGPFGSVGNRAATLSWLGGAPMTKGTSSGPFNTVADMNAWIDRNGKGSGNSGFMDLGGLMGYMRDESRGWLKKKFFDRGGLATSIGIMQKNIQSPERVLSPQQTRAFEGALDRGFRPNDQGPLELSDRTIERLAAAQARLMGLESTRAVADNNHRQIMEIYK